MKKYIKLILVGCGLLFSLLVFATMAGDAVYTSGFGLTLKASIYDFIGDGNGLGVTCLIFLILIILATLTMLAFEFLKKFNEYNHFIAAGAALFALVSAILFFCFATGDYKDFSLGAGAVWSGLFMIFTALSLGGFATLKFLKKID